MVNSAAQVTAMVDGWKAEGKTKSEIVALAAEAEIGWSYVWGTTGQECTPGKREAATKRCSEAEASVARKKCQVLREAAPRESCSGCKYYPGGKKTLMDDCQGFVKQVCKRVGISFVGGGCTSMWNNNNNWSSKGTIDTLPETVCCVFWTSSTKPNVKSHIGFYIGGGMMIHCSGEVKKEKLSSKCTHWAVPKGLDGDIPVPTHKTIKRGSTGPDVVECQQDLIYLGYDLGKSGADGKFGVRTEEAVKSFQKTHKGPDGKALKVDGIVGSSSWWALDEAMKPAGALYTVTIMHLKKSDADALCAVYPNATAVKE